MTPTADKAFQIMQIISFTVVLIATVFIIAWMTKKETNWLWGIPWLAITIHASIFYLAIFARDSGILVVEKSNTFTNWSAVLRLQTYTTMAILAYSLVSIVKCKRKKATMTVGIEVTTEKTDG